MRSYDVSLFVFLDGKFVKSAASACWAMCNYPQMIDPSIKNKDYGYMKGKEIYISRFNDKETAKYKKLLVSTINDITPCEIVRYGIKYYIKFKMMETYDQSLILLNFIRNLWHQPTPGYTKKFFESLKIADQKDPLERLTWANKEASPNVVYPPGHSNVFCCNKLILKKKKELLNYTGRSVERFLCEQE